MTKKIRVFSVASTAVALLWLIFGLFVWINSEVGRALFIEVFLPVLGIIAGLWVIVYAISIKSWKFFWLWLIILASVWTGLWFLLD